MNMGPRPGTIDKLRRVNKLRSEMSVPAACARVGISKMYYWRFKKKYPHLVSEAGYDLDDDYGPSN